MTILVGFKLFFTLIVVFIFKAADSDNEEEKKSEPKGKLVEYPDNVYQRGNHCLFLFCEEILCRIIVRILESKHSCKAYQKHAIIN